jgi:GH3 auxin-responsive promoter
MGLKASIAQILAKRISNKLWKDAQNAVACQQRIFHQLIRVGRKTAFGKDHHFDKIQTHAEFVQWVKPNDYEYFIPYIERIKNGEPNVLWKGRPLYLCKTSGTTSGTKYIPLTKESLPNHISSARNALFCYIAQTGNADFVDGKMIFLQGSPKLDHLPSGVAYGRLSGIVANHVPAYLQKNRMPSFETNCIEDWEQKVHAITDETIHQPMTLISGIPSWVQMYFEILLQKTGKSTVAEIFPQFNLFVYGGVNFEPYRSRFQALVGKRIPSIELYPASEGFIAFQDSQTEDGLWLNVNSGIFYEFVKADAWGQTEAERLTLAQVELNVNYVILLTTNAGLWSYCIGDTIKFVNLAPHRIKVTGRIKHFTSAFGEHIIAEEADKAMAHACAVTQQIVDEFHLAPQVHPAEGLPYHEWFVEADDALHIHILAEALDQKMQELNIYYKDLIAGHVLQKAQVTLVPRGTFNRYMASQGKLGGQNKLPRLSNDRKIADALG